MTEAEFNDPIARRAAIERLLEESRLRDGEKALVRPRIYWVKALLNVIIPAVISVGLFLLLWYFLPKYNKIIAPSVAFGGLGLYMLLRLRAIMIWCITVYQAYAPEETRRRCVFTPTCSEYAIAALRKYGVIRGTIKTVKRLARCHPPNGGIDEP